MAITPGIHSLTIMMSFVFPRPPAARLRYFVCCFVNLLLLGSISAFAHDHHGPPARIITDEQVGPWTISVWAQQHMDMGRFFVQVRSSSGATVPDDLKVEIGVAPAGQNSPVTFYPASREPQSHETQDGQYTAEAPFDTEKSWQVTVRLKSSRGIYETTTYLGASPPGVGQWQLLLYSLPFLSVGGLWLRVYRLRRRARGSLALEST
jgi:hypothetical protein